MKLISDQKQLINNIETLENIIAEGSESEKKEATDLTKRGTCFVAYQIENEIRFAPSRFIGYINNKLKSHIISKSKDGRKTNKAINEILGVQPSHNKELEQKYIQYCICLGIKPNSKGAFGVERKYWKLNIEKEFEKNELSNEGFPEGKIIERIHKSRERSYKVIDLAKKRFLDVNGSLFCQVCGFDFEKTYGKLGEYFIEGHHTIAVSEMSHEQKTRVEDIVLVCSNCHRMIHKKRPWLKMSELKKILN
ncbi:HNH endonuclease [Bacteroides sp.]|uniref:HNH endonuclease n=1 Tax=Bacteroides sp. TaxID=29523 RepID=UPI002FC9F44A